MSLQATVSADAGSSRLAALIRSRARTRRVETASWLFVFAGVYMILASRIHHGEIAPIWRHDRWTLLGLLSLGATIVGLALSWSTLFGKTPSIDTVASPAGTRGEAA